MMNDNVDPLTAQMIRNLKSQTLEEEEEEREKVKRFKSRMSQSYLQEQDRRQKSSSASTTGDVQAFNNGTTFQVTQVLKMPASKIQKDLTPDQFMNSRESVQAGQGPRAGKPKLARD